MQNESTYQNSQLNEFLNGLKVALLISVAFFLALIFREEPSSWFTVLKVSLGYGIFIYPPVSGKLASKLKFYY